MTENVREGMTENVGDGAPGVGNPFSDFEITDPRAMRALSHPVRLRILATLQARGPSTATVLAPTVGASPSVVSWHLRHLSSFGLIRDAEPSMSDGRQRWWQAVSRGFRFAMPSSDDASARASYALLSAQMFRQYEHVPQVWLRDVAPGLDEQWSRLAGLANTRVVVTPDELAGIGAAIEQVLAPYVLRRDAERTPGNARSVRMLRFTLPQGDVAVPEGWEHGDPGAR
jgi:DNA-binding transcriptional ArsR family regulator